MNSEIRPNLLKPRWRKVFSDLWDDKTRTTLVVSSVAVGIFAIGMIITAYVILREDVPHSYASVNPPNIVVYTDDFDDELVRVIEKVPEVEQVQGRRSQAIRARRGNEDWQELTLVGMDDFPSNISRLAAIEGAAIPAKDEVVISQDVMHISGYHAGDVIEVEFPDGATRLVRISGLAADQTTSKPDPNANNLAFFTLDTLRSFGQESRYNQLYITVVGDGTDGDVIDRVAARVDDKVDRSRREVYRLEKYFSDEHPMGDLSLAILGVLGALGALITILSSSLIINTLNALLTQQLRQIGVMKLVGGRSYQILAMYLTLIIAYGLIALALAVPAAALVGYGLAWFISYTLGAVLQGFRIIPAAILAQVLIAILVPLGAGFFPVSSGARTSVQQAISNYRPVSSSTRSTLLNRNPSWFRWVSRPLLLSFRNTFRKTGRLLLTIFTLTVAGGVFIAVFNVRDSLDNIIDQLLQHFLGDVTVDMRYPYRVSTMEQTLLEIPGVRGVEGWTAASVELWDENDRLVTNLSVVAPPQDTQLLDLDLVAGRWLLPGEEKAIVVADSIYNFYPHLQVGDRLRVKIQGGRVEQWEVVGIFPFLALFGDPMAYANFEFIAGINHLSSHAASFRVIIDDHSDASQRALTRRIDDYLTEGNYAVSSVESGYAMQGKAKVVLNILIVFLLVMAILTASVGSIGLTGAMSINVLERTREIGVMRTIGAVDAVIMRSVIFEALVIGLITWLLAIGLSFPISTMLLKIIGEAVTDTPMALHFTPLGALLWLGVVSALSVISSLIPARNAASLTINEVLAYE